MAYRTVERTKVELTDLQDALSQLTQRIVTVRDLLREATKELSGADCPVDLGQPDRALASRVAEAVISQLSVNPQVCAIRKRYVREREAATVRTPPACRRSTESALFLWWTREVPAENAF